MSTTDLFRQHQKYTQEQGEILGDCFRTAIACLLEVPRDEVPHFIADYAESAGLDWYYAAQRFVQNRLPGWTLVCLRPVYPVYEFPENAPRFVILTGDSPRGPWLHSVLVDATDGTPAWDPYPGGTGVGLPADIIALQQVEVHTNANSTVTQGQTSYSVTWNSG